MKEYKKMEVRDAQYIRRFMGSSAEVWCIAGKFYLLESYGDGRYEATPMIDELTIDRNAKSFTVEQILKGIGEPSGMDGNVPPWDEYELVGFDGDFPGIDEEIRKKLSDALYDDFDGFDDSEIVAGVAASATVNVAGVKYYAETGVTDNKLSENATPEEVTSLLDNLVKDAVSRYVSEERHLRNVELNRKWWS